MSSFEKKRGIYTSIFLILCFSLADTKNNSFSKAKMENLLETERLLIKYIKAEFLDLKEQINILQSFLSDINIEHQKSEHDPEAYLSNPLNAFALIRRTHEGWPKIFQNIQRPRNVERTAMLKNVQLPTSEDLQASVADLEHMRVSHDLQPIDIANGLMNGKQYNPSLSAFNAFTIGFELFKLEKFDAAVSWFNVSINAEIHSQLPKEISQFDIVKSHLMYVKTLSLLDKEIEALEAVEKVLELYPENELVIEMHKAMKKNLLLKNSKEL